MIAPETLPDGVVKAADLPLYDLVIASQKFGYGATDTADAPILWWKLAGQAKEVPAKKCRLTDPAIQRRLLSYKLVATEVRTRQIIRKYIKVASAEIRR